MNYGRYSWTFETTFNRLRVLLYTLRKNYVLRSKLTNQEVDVLRKALPKRNLCCFGHKPANFIETRAEQMRNALQQLLEVEEFWNYPMVREFIHVSPSSFNPTFGPKPLEFWAKKSSGGFHTGYSRKWGDYFTMKVWRWLVVHKNSIRWFRDAADPVMKGIFHVNSGAKLFFLQKEIHFMNGTRVLRIRGHNAYETLEIFNQMAAFYNGDVQIMDQPHMSSFPIRVKQDCRVYTVSKDYFAGAAAALLGAKHEILIASWKNSPRVLLTRPPLAPLRLDQILAFKAQQGVKIYILLYKEVEMSGQGNDSGLAQAYLQNLHPNIRVLRHPNKFVGGATAVLWSHHEKLCVVDRSMAFVGGIDMAIGRWDDVHHTMVDPYGLKYPGHDYRQPAEHMHIPVEESVAKARVLKKESGGLFQTAIDGISDNFERAIKAIGLNMGNNANKNEPAPALPNPLDAEHSMLEDNESVSQTDGRESTASSNASQHSTLWNTASGAEAASGKKKFESRDLYPRTGWHDCQCCVSGVAARDVAAHFVERWNHHRLSVGSHRAPQLAYMTSETRWCICPRCKRSGIFELETACPTCLHDLGPVSPLLLPPTPQQLPAPIAKLNYAGSQIHSEIHSDLESASATEMDSKEGTPWQQQIQQQMTQQAVNEVQVHTFIDYECHVYGFPYFELSGDAPVVVSSTKKAAPAPLGSIKEGDDTSESSALAGAASGAGAASPTSPTGEPEVAVRSSNESRPSAPGKSPSITPLPTQRNYASPGNLVCSTGSKEDVKALIAEGFKPHIGDIVLKVEGRDVSHINSKQLIRYIDMQCTEHKEDTPVGDSPLPLNFTFRRHFTLRVMRGVRLASFSAQTASSKEISDKVESPLFGVKTKTQVPEAHLASLNAVKFDWSLTHKSEGLVGNIGNSINILLGKLNMGMDHTNYSEMYMIEQCRAAAALQVSYNASLVYHNAPLDWSSTVSGASTASLPISQETVAQTINTKDSLAVAQVVDSVGNTSIPAIAPVEIAVGTILSDEESNAYDPAAMPALPKCTSEPGSCHVQVLRSVTSWSIGKAVPECSISNAWIDAINDAQRLVYLENQFFIGSAGQGPQAPNARNRIPEAILNRIIRAARQKEKFKCIIVIPQHPQGDVAFTMRPRIILHYQCETINKGIYSLIERFKASCPGSDPNEYIGFFCLHNYGIMNNIFVHDQVYVHDKLLCVDDRILIVGSANINDRSMLGERDSEVAVRIEDEEHLTIKMGGADFTVGCLPHQVRCRLMRQHLGDLNGTVSVDDAISSEFYDEKWRVAASNNQHHYSTIDKERDVYAASNRNLSTYRTALDNYINPFVSDEAVQRALDTENGGIKGTLIPWPMDFLYDEDLQPNLATRSLIPTALWV